MNQVLAEIVLDNWMTFCASYLNKPVAECQAMFERGELVCVMDNGLILTHKAHYLTLRPQFVFHVG